MKYKTKKIISGWLIVDANDNIVATSFPDVYPQFLVPQHWINDTVKVLSDAEIKYNKKINFGYTSFERDIMVLAYMEGYNDAVAKYKSEPTTTNYHVTLKLNDLPEEIQKPLIINDEVTILSYQQI